MREVVGDLYNCNMTAAVAAYGCRNLLAEECLLFRMGLRHLSGRRGRPRQLLEGWRYAAGRHGKLSGRGC